MRQFARICVNLPDDGKLAYKLESLLNTEVSIKNTSKSTSASQSFGNDRSLQDYETVDPGVIAQPDFKYLTVAEKIGRIEDYHKLK